MGEVGKVVPTPPWSSLAAAFFKHRGAWPDVGELGSSAQRVERRWIIHPLTLAEMRSQFSPLVSWSSSADETLILGAPVLRNPSVPQGEALLISEEVTPEGKRVEAGWRALEEMRRAYWMSVKNYDLQTWRHWLASPRTLEEIMFCLTGMREPVTVTVGGFVYAILLLGRPIKLAPWLPDGEIALVTEEQAGV